MKIFRWNISRAVFYSKLEKLEYAVLSKVLPVFKYSMVLESEGDFTDSIRTFYDYLIDNKYNNRWKITWIVHEPQKYKRHKNVCFVSRYRRFNPLLIFKLATARYFLFSHPYWFTKWRKGQTVIYTTHSVAQLKNAPIKKGFFVPYDFVLSCSDASSQQRSITLREPDLRKFLCLGLPRIDLLYKHRDCRRDLIQDYNNQLLILSMQTFKKTAAWSDSDNIDPFAINVINTIQELQSLDEFLEQRNAFLIIKIHHLQDLSQISAVNLKHIRYITDEGLQKYDIQVNQLLENADILLTDYSSVFYEFLLLNRPIGFLIGDIDQYKRGFIVDDPLAEMPGEKIRSYAQLETFIANVCEGKDNYERMRLEIKDKYIKFQDDNNCKRLFNWLQDNM